MGHCVALLLVVKMAGGKPLPSNLFGRSAAASHDLLLFSGSSIPGDEEESLYTRLYSSSSSSSYFLCILFLSNISLVGIHSCVDTRPTCFSNFLSFFFFCFLLLPAEEDVDGRLGI